MILEVEKGKFSIDLSEVESIEKLTDMEINISMKSGQRHKVKYPYASIVAVWAKTQDDKMAILKNLDENTFRPRL